MASRRNGLVERRKAMGLSQERLAEIVGVDRSTVVRWERADSSPQPWLRPRLARALKVTAEGLSDLLADVGAAPSAPDEGLQYATRNPGGVDLVSVARLREQIRQVDERYERTPSALLLGAAGQLHGQAVFLRQHAATGRMRRDLCAAELESAMLMGQLVWDASQRRTQAAALAYFDQAIAAARIVRDVVAEAHAELRKCYVALYGAGNPAEGLALAQRAAAASKRDSHVIAGLALLHAGEAHAMLRQRQSCEQALGLAEKHFSQVGPYDPAAALFCPSQHSRVAGSCWLFLGQPTTARKFLDRSRRILKERKKSTAIVLGNLARASVQERDIDAAAAYLGAAVEVLEATRGGGGLNVVFTAARELRPWRDEPAVQAVTDRLLALMAATT